MQLGKIFFKETISYPEFEGFARSLSWSLFEEWQEDDETPEHISWLTPDGIAVVIMQDDILNTSYIAVIGDDVSAAETILRERFPSFSWQEAVTQFREATSVDEKINMLSAIAITAPEEFEQLPYDAIRTALEDDEPDVRSTAVVATIYAPWTEFLPHLQKVAADTGNTPAVRETASATAEAIRERHGGPVPEECCSSGDLVT